MKKFIILSVLLALSLFAFNCGGGSGSSNSPKGENPGEPSVVQLLPSHYIAQTNSIITLHSKVLDGNGAPVNNIPVSFTNLSPIGVLSATSAKTNSTGIASVTLKSTTTGFATVQVEVNKGVSQVRDRKTVFFSTNLNLQPYMILDVDGDNDVTYNEASDLILFENTDDNQVIIRATVFNRFGDRAAFTSVTFGADSLEASFPLGSIKTTDANGEAFVLVRVDPIAIRNLETVLNITAEADNGAFNMVSLFLKPVTVQTVNISADPTVLAPNAKSAITTSVILNTGGPAPDGTVVSFTTSCGTVTPFAQTTSGAAEAEFTAPSTKGVCVITAKAGGVSGTTSVTVTTPLSVSPSAQTINGAPGGNARFAIFGGVPPYSVFSNNTLFAPNPASGISDGGNFTVTVLPNTPATSVTFTIRDSVGATVPATLSITFASTDFYLLPSSATIPVDGSMTFRIFGGTLPFDLFVDNPVVDIMYDTSMDERSFTVIGNSSGSANITVRDANNRRITASVTVQ